MILMAATTVTKLRTREEVIEKARAATKSYVSAAVTIQINDAWCKGCAICVAFCPKDVLEMNRMDKVEVKALEACTKCLRCEQLCPDFAIVVFGEPGKSKG
ncbi:MAG TPA: 4Fe-4S dicluster domain-containing protein [Candidatus Methylomirabilis sp.]|jgi:2-oxoglutarate ferredoxin oxidoreductase subunit delta|nr:4Fe-4S dicluster domain-containing protein [Candidatus Methylomirabilis sp.]